MILSTVYFVSAHFVILRMYSIKSQCVWTHLCLYILFLSVSVSLSDVQIFTMSDASVSSEHARKVPTVTRFDQMPVSSFNSPKYCNVDVFVKGAYFVPPTSVSDTKRVPALFTLVCDFSGALIKMSCTQDVMTKLCIAMRKHDFCTPVRLFNCFRTEIAAMWAMTCLDGIGLTSFQIHCDDSTNVGLIDPAENSQIPVAPRCAVSLRGDFPTTRSECVYSVVVGLVKFAERMVNPRDASTLILKCGVIDSTGRVLVITDWNHEKHPWATTPVAGAPAAFFFFVPPADTPKSRGFDNSRLLQNMSLSFVSTHCLGQTMSRLWNDALTYKEVATVHHDKPASAPDNAITIAEDDIAELMRERGMAHKAAMSSAH